jgi:hypothetical protein
MTWQIIVLILGVFVLLIELLAFWSEVRIARTIRAVEKGQISDPLYNILLDTDIFLDDSINQKSPSKSSFNYESYDKVKVFESWSTEDKKVILGYIKSQQLNKINKNRHSGVLLLLRLIIRIIYAFSIVHSQKTPIQHQSLKKQLKKNR